MTLVFAGLCHDMGHTGIAFQVFKYVKAIQTYLKSTVCQNLQLDTMISQF